MRLASLHPVPHNPKVAGSNPAPATNFPEALPALSWWGLRVSSSASLHFVQILSRTAAAFGDAGFDPLHRIAQVVLLDDVVALEDGSGAVPRHPHYHRLRHSSPACVGDEAAPQVVKPDAVELRRLACPAKRLADVLPRLLSLWIGEDPLALDVPRLRVECFQHP